MVNESPDDAAVSKLMRGIRASRPAWEPVRTLASITLDLNFVTMSLVPLHSPLAELRLRRRITGQPTFSRSSWAGIPANVRVFKYSCGMLSSGTPPSRNAESALR